MGRFQQNKLIEDDRKKLQGRWKVISEIRNEKVVVQREPTYLTIVGGVADWSGPVGGHTTLISLDPSARPKVFDVRGFNEDYTVEMRGVYTLEANSLKVCWQEGRGERPKEFSTEGDRNVVLYVFQRVSTKRRKREE